MNPELEHKVFTQRELYSFLYFILIFFILIYRVVAFPLSISGHIHCSWPLDLQCPVLTCLIALMNVSILNYAFTSTYSTAAFATSTIFA